MDIEKQTFVYCLFVCFLFELILLIKINLDTFYQDTTYNCTSLQSGHNDSD